MSQDTGDKVVVPISVSASILHFRSAEDLDNSLDKGDKEEGEAYYMSITDGKSRKIRSSDEHKEGTKQIHLLNPNPKEHDSDIYDQEDALSPSINQPYIEVPLSSAEVSKNPSAVNHHRNPRDLSTRKSELKASPSTSCDKCLIY